MGNQESSQMRGPIERRSRYRSIDNSVLINKSKIGSSRKNDESFQENSIFVTPPINRSYDSRRRAQQQSEKGQSQSEPVNDRSIRNYESIDVNQLRKNIGSNGKAERSEKDRVLLTLSRKNEELRKQLKTISDELTEKLKRKKLVPKKKDAKHDDNESEVDNKQAEKELMGFKRELENAYKQIEMYKKILLELKSKQEGVTADHRVNVLENEIAIKNQEIEKCQQKKLALEKIRNKQLLHIKQQINEDLQNGIDTYKKQVEQLHNRLKKYAKQDRARQEAYKKQQAYLCDLERKWRQLDDSYFPELSNKLKKEQQKTATSDKEVNEREFYHVAEEARLLRIKHEEYNRKIEMFLQLKNKRIEDQNDLKDQILYKERIIEALKAKIATIQKLLKPRKTNLFGYENQSQQGSEVQSQFNDNQSEIERQLQEELNQDQFDIKHLIANIPKPVRKRPQQISNGYSSGQSQGGGGVGKRKMGGGMIITSQKAEPKRWGAVTTRSEERGKHFKGELAFEDKGQFESDVQPIIVGVNVWVNKNNTILGIQAIYLNNNELRYGAKSSESADGIIKRFDLQTPDYLKNLSLTITREGFVESLTLYSKQGKIGKFGNKRAQDENVNFGLSSNERPYMFFGASSLFQTEPRLNCFGIEICYQ